MEALPVKLIEEYYDIVFLPFMRFFKSLSEENCAKLLAVRDGTGKPLPEKKVIATETLIKSCNAFLASPNAPVNEDCLVFWAFLTGIDRVESIRLVSDYGMRPLNGQETSFPAFGLRQNPDSEKFVKLFHDTFGAGHFEGLIGSSGAYTSMLPSSKKMAEQVIVRLRGIIERSKTLGDPLCIPEKALQDLIPRTRVELLQLQVAALQQRVSNDPLVISLTSDSDDEADNLELAKIAAEVAAAELVAARAKLVAAKLANKNKLKTAAAAAATSSSSETAEPTETRGSSPDSGGSSSSTSSNSNGSGSGINSNPGSSRSGSNSDSNSDASCSGAGVSNDSVVPTIEEDDAPGLTGGGSSVDHSVAIETAMIAAKEIAIEHGEIFRYVFSLPAKDSSDKCFFEYDSFEEGWLTVADDVRVKLSNIAKAKRSKQTKAAKVLLIDRVVSYLIGHVENVTAFAIGFQRTMTRKYQTLFLHVAPNCSIKLDDIRYKFDTEREAIDLISTESPVVEIPDSQNSQ